MADLDLPYSNAHLTCKIPERLLGEIVRPNRLCAPKKLPELLEECLSNPIGSVPLAGKLRPGQTVAIVVDDISRPTPVADILPSVLDRLSGAGIRKEAICIVIALGSHRPLTAEEIEKKLGREVAQGYPIVNDPCDSKKGMEIVGYEWGDIPISINRQVVQADVRIGIGAICPHMDAGFSGGGKIILPGVCDCRTVDAFHAGSARVSGNHLGNSEAPTRKRLESFVARYAPLDFIVNLILDSAGNVYRCVAGDPILAHRQGVNYAREVYGVPVKKQYPLVISNSYPFEIDFWQCTKAYWSGDLMTADKGMTVVVSPCPEGTQTHPLWAEYMGWETRDLEKLLESGKAEDPNACAFAVMFCRLRERIRFGIVCPTITEKEAKEMKLIYFESIEEVIEESGLADTRNSVAIIPHGGVTFPIL